MLKMLSKHHLNTTKYKRIGWTRHYARSPARTIPFAICHANVIRSAGLRVSSSCKLSVLLLLSWENAHLLLSLVDWKENNTCSNFMTQKGNRKMKLDVFSFLPRFSPLKTGNVTSANWWRPGDGQAHDDVKHERKLTFFFKLIKQKQKQVSELCSKLDTWTLLQFW